MSDDSLELMKAAGEGVAEGTIRGLLAPITDFASAVFGEPARQVGGYLADAVRGKRLELQIRVFARAQAMCETAGIEPGRVEWKVLVPLLMGAANEDPEEDSMVDRWAALLANAASGDAGVFVHPSFPEILSQLSGRDARLLQAIQDAEPGGNETLLLTTMAVHLELDVADVALATLERFGLIELNTTAIRMMGATSKLELTPLGQAFLDACSPPSGAQAGA